jgi:hypothetical protein
VSPVVQFITAIIGLTAIVSSFGLLIGFLYLNAYYAYFGIQHGSINIRTSVYVRMALWPILLAGFLLLLITTCGIWLNWSIAGVVHCLFSQGWTAFGIPCAVALLALCGHVGLKSIGRFIARRTVSGWHKDSRVIEFEWTGKLPPWLNGKELILIEFDGETYYVAEKQEWPPDKPVVHIIGKDNVRSAKTCRLHER